jgi:hypothetical protein
MYRTLNTLRWVGPACALTLALGCNSAPSAPSSADNTAPSDQGANADGSTLKVNAPRAISPADDVRIDSRRPTMVLTNASGVFVNRAFSYEFQLLSDSGSVIASTTLPGGDGTTTWAYPDSLERDTAYRWQARAVHGDKVGPWSSSVRFFTVREPRTPDPSPGQRLPLPNMAHIVAETAARFPGAFANSCQEHGGSWEFMDRLIDRLREFDTRWGYNWKRAVPGDPSLDVINYHFGDGPDEGARDVYTVDVLLGHCGVPAPAWINITDFNGAGAMWTSRGRW